MAATNTAEMVRAIAAHADFMGVPPEGIHGLTPKSVKKKLKQPSFTAAVNREEVRQGAEVVIAALEAKADELELHGRAAA